MRLAIIRYIYATGETFLYWYGMQPRICISDPELVKQTLLSKFDFYVKPTARPSVEKLVGRGLILGFVWEFRGEWNGME